MALLTETLWEKPDFAPLKPFLKGKYYALSKWPNFGFSKCNPVFVQVCAYLGRSYLSKKDILSVVDINEQLLDYFLNTANLLGILEVKNSSEGSKNETPSPVDRFTRKLKQLFRFNAS
ncbi:hypothetical protein [Marinicella sp. W31]|uniref:hypothetical protein n=1 Tax=Marinicella sp. W31 TaxID=3023713 RepID=UPI003757B2C9